MTLFDYVVLTIIGASVLVSVVRGLAREVLALAGWVAAFVAAAMLSSSVADLLTPYISSAPGRALVAFAGIFLMTLLAMSLLALAVSGILKRAGLGLEDRLLGGFFGFARGLVIVMVLVLLGGLTAAPRQPVWNDAMLSPPLEALAAAMKPWLPQILSSNLSYD